jgi:hypothetical protein
MSDFVSWCQKFRHDGKNQVHLVKVIGFPKAPYGFRYLSAVILEDISLNYLLQAKYSKQVWDTSNRSICTRTEFA